MESKLNRRAHPAVLASLTALGLIFAPSAMVGYEQENQYENLDPVQVQELEMKMERYGVVQRDRGALLSALDRGEMWDSMTDANPVDTEVLAIDGVEMTVDRYADGSLIATGTEIPTQVSEGEPTPNNVTCTASRPDSNNTYWSNCRVWAEGLLVGASYRADWHQFNSRTTMSASASHCAGSEMINKGVGSYSNVSLTPPVPSWSSGTPARVRLSFDSSMPGYGGMQRLYLELYVHPTTHTTGNNLGIWD